MGVYAIKGDLVLKDTVLENGAVIVEDGIITYAGALGGVSLPEKVYDYTGSIIAPGFVDIHCHGSPEVMGYDDPAAVAKYHNGFGTTSLLISLYRNLTHAQTMDAIRLIEKTMPDCPSIAGVHMEGPYLNPSLGSKKQTVDVKTVPSEYREIMATGLVRQWTFSPEIEGSMEFCKEISEAGIVPAIGHSCASCERVRKAYENGARIVTHLMNATGSSVSPTAYGGTKEVDFDAACMLQDGFYYEVINDKYGIHVRKDMLKLIIKTVGIDSVVGITDCYAGNPDGNDVNFLDGAITGSKLSMDNVARNFFNLGLTLPEVFKTVSLNPARAVKIEGSVGSIEKGKTAGLLITDRTLTSVKVFKENA